MITPAGLIPVTCVVPCAAWGSFTELTVPLAERTKLVIVLVQEFGLQTKFCTLPATAPGELMAAALP